MHVSTGIGVWEIIRAGGGMLWPIVLCSIMAMAVVIRAWAFLRDVTRDIPRLFAAVLACLDDNDLKAAIVCCERTGSPVSRIIHQGIVASERGRDAVCKAMDEAAISEVPRLESGLKPLEALSVITPLLGLLAALLSLSQIFYLIITHQSAHVPVDHQILAHGLSRSLILAAAGLWVAIPTLMAYLYLANLTRQSILQVQSAASAIADVLASYHEHGRPARVPT